MVFKSKKGLKGPLLYLTRYPVIIATIRNTARTQKKTARGVGETACGSLLLEDIPPIPNARSTEKISATAISGSQKTPINIGPAGLSHSPAAQTEEKITEKKITRALLGPL